MATAFNTHTHANLLFNQQSFKLKISSQNTAYKVKLYVGNIEMRYSNTDRIVLKSYHTAQSTNI